MIPVALSEIHDHGLHPLMNSRLPSQPELLEDRVDGLLDRPLGYGQVDRDRCVVHSLGHPAQNVPFPLRELAQRRGCATSRLGDQAFYDLWVDERPTRRNGANRGDELTSLRYALLEQIRATVAAALEQRQRVTRAGVLAQDDDSDARVRFTQSSGDPDSLIGVAGRHPDVGDDNVRASLVDGDQQGIKVPARGDDFEPRLCLEQPLDTLTYEEMILSEHEPQRHAQRIRP
jgi:hypothetical protein